MTLERLDDEVEFERSLLDAARGEALPPRAATERAWQRFSAVGGRAAVSIGGGTGRAWLSSGKLTWLATGIITGSVTTAVLVAPRGAAPNLAVPTSAPVTVPPAADGLSAGAVLAEGAVPAESAVPAEGARPAEGPMPAEGARKRRAVRVTAPPGLESEVRALDAIRGALDDGRPSDALDAVDVFHWRFPRAQLAADADGLAIEALLARGDTGAATERAARFLRRYPSDPHVPRFAPLAGGNR